MEINDIETSYKSKTYTRRVPCGNLYIIITFRNEEDKKDKIEFVRIIPFKSNECGGSFFETIADLLTFSIKRIRNQHEADSIIKSLEYHRCNKVLPGKKVSCSDAIASVLKDIIGKEDGR